MRSSRAFAWILACLLVGLVSLWIPLTDPVTVLAQETGTIQGTVTLGASGEPVVGATVRLVHYDGMQAAETLTAETDGEGRFRFEDLATGEEQVYIASVGYSGVTYSSPMLIFSAGESTLIADIEVYEPTTDGSGVGIDRAHVIVSPSTDGLQVAEMLQVSNSGSGTYVGEAGTGSRQPTLRIPLPEGASNITFDAGELGGRFVEIDGGVADTEPIPPGKGVAQILLSYELPAQRDTWSLAFHFDYPVGALNVLISGDAWDVSSEDLAYSGDMGGEQKFRNFAAQDLAAGQEVSLTLVPASGSPATGATAGGTIPKGYQGEFLWIALGLGILLGAGVAVYPLWRERR